MRFYPSVPVEKRRGAEKEGNDTRQRKRQLNPRNNSSENSAVNAWNWNYNNQNWNNNNKNNTNSVVGVRSYAGTGTR